MPEQGPANPPSPRVTIVVSRYNRSITDALLAGARAEYADRTGSDSEPRIIDAPGSFELPLLALAAASRTPCDGVLALACIIRGQTSHDRHIARAVACGLTDVSLRTGVPVAFGVLTVETPEQARARAGGERGNKGREAMAALLDTIASLSSLEGAAPPAGRVHPRPDKAARPDGAAHG